MNSEPLSPSSTILDAIHWATARFKSCPIDSPRLNAELLLCQIVNMSRLDLYMKFDQPISGEEIKGYTDLVSRRMTGEPVQYIIGQVEFYSLSFKVSPDVLIPRPETEILVDQALNYIRELDTGSESDPVPSESQLDLFSSSPVPKRQDASGGRVIVDVGTGSGVIASTIAFHCSDVTVYASDISREALNIARQNAKALDVKINFLQGPDLEPLEGYDLKGKIDLIISNPPYISTAMIEHLPVEVRDYEPRQALDGGEDGLDHIRTLIQNAPSHLRPGGKIMMEISEEQGQPIIGVLEADTAFDDVQLIQDYNGLNRVVCAVRTDV